MVLYIWMFSDKPGLVSVSWAEWSKYFFEYKYLGKELDRPSIVVRLKDLLRKQKSLEDQKFNIDLFEYYTGYWDGDYEWLELKDSSEK